MKRNTKQHENKDFCEETCHDTMMTFSIFEEFSQSSDVEVL